MFSRRVAVCTDQINHVTFRNFERGKADRLTLLKPATTKKISTFFQTLTKSVSTASKTQSPAPGSSPTATMYSRESGKLVWIVRWKSTFKIKSFLCLKTGILRSIWIVFSSIACIEQCDLGCTWRGDLGNNVYMKVQRILQCCFQRLNLLPVSCVY